MIIQRMTSLDRVTGLKPVTVPPLTGGSELDDARPADGLPRSEFLKLVQQKIKKGFYSTEAVLEDISHSFANTFDKIV